MLPRSRFNRKMHQGLDEESYLYHRSKNAATRATGSSLRIIPVVCGSRRRVARRGAILKSKSVQSVLVDSGRINYRRRIQLNPAAPQKTCRPSLAISQFGVRIAGREKGWRSKRDGPRPEARDEQGWRGSRAGASASASARAGWRA